MGLAAMSGAPGLRHDQTCFHDGSDKRRALMIDIGFGVVAFLATWWLYNPGDPWMQLIASGAIG